MLECLTWVEGATCSYGLESLDANLRKRNWKANTTRGKVISSRNQLFTNGKRLFVQLPEDLQAEAMFWGRVKNLWSKQIYFFRFVVRFSKKLKKALYIGWQGYRRRKIIQNGALFITIQILATSVGQNFQVILWRDLGGRNYFRGHLNIVPATVFLSLVIP